MQEGHSYVRGSNCSIFKAWRDHKELTLKTSDKVNTSVWAEWGGLMNQGTRPTSEEGALNGINDYY